MIIYSGEGLAVKQVDCEMIPQAQPKTLYFASTAEFNGFLAALGVQGVKQQGEELIAVDDRTLKNQIAARLSDDASNFAETLGFKTEENTFTDNFSGSDVKEHNARRFTLSGSNQPMSKQAKILRRLQQHKIETGKDESGNPKYMTFSQDLLYAPTFGTREFREGGGAMIMGDKFVMGTENLIGFLTGDDHAQILHELRHTSDRWLAMAGKSNGEYIRITANTPDAVMKKVGDLYSRGYDQGEARAYMIEG